MSKYTPMIEQYLAIKAECTDALLFFRLGDFYEMFFTDAETASRELEITLTSREGGSEQRIPMCGVPYHAAENYIVRLIDKGYKVAICEQVEDPKQARGIVRREIIRVVTPGTVINESLLSDKQNNFLVCLAQKTTGFFFASIDISTGEFYLGQFNGNDALPHLIDELYRMRPRECILLKPLDRNSKLVQFITQNIVAALTIIPAETEETSPETLFAHFQLKAETAVFAEIKENAAALSLLAYVANTQKCELRHINTAHVFSPNQFMQLDIVTQRNLELTRNLREGQRRGTLLSVLDFTFTAMGGRLLRRWIEQPLKQVTPIQHRLDAVDAFVKSSNLRERVKEALTQVYDMERLISKLAFATANARDLLALKQSLSILPDLKIMIKSADCHRLHELSLRMPLFTELAALLDSAIQPDPPFSVREGNLIQNGFNSELDQLRDISRNAKLYLSQLEQSEKEKTGIKSLKISFNKVFGYYIEVTNSNLTNVPETYIRKQTLANAERFITPELKALEDKILGAEEKIISLEYHLFTQLREQILQHIEKMQEASRIVAEIDVLYSLAEAAVRYHYTKPAILSNGEIKIEEGRHPVVERLLSHDIFVPNDTLLNHGDHEMVVITGPNMAGKSTYMRQVALITLMAQMGSFVPAKSVQIGIVDRIFTRVGASDDLAMGQSTFMVEMAEVGHILQHASRHSLIILDEIGRGTSTFDGMSIAQAIIEHIVQHVHAKTLFATHYHELTALENNFAGVVNYSVAVKERGEDIVFLRRIIRGGADRSYGIHVARLAGLPQNVLTRANEILELLQDQRLCQHQAAATQSHHAAEEKANGAVSLFDDRQTVLEELLKVDVMTMTPIEAINTLFKLQLAAKQG